MSTLNSSQPLWDFALAFYVQPQVAETCLHLQDNYRANVCLMIGLHWMDAQEQYLSELDIADLSAHTQPWTQQIIAPLRELRRQLKQPFENYSPDETQKELRALVKRAELFAEKKLLIEIECQLEKISTNSNFTQGTTNLAKYMTTLEIEKSFIELIQKKFNG